MKIIRNLIGLLVLIALAGGAWVVRYHSDWLAPAQKEEAETEVAPEVPVKTAQVVRATLCRYVEGFGAVEPAPARDGRPPAGAALASPVSGIVAKVLCEAGQRVARGVPLVQLDDRTAAATEDEAAAAVESAKAGLAKLKATPRPEQLEVAQLAVEKARSAAEFAEKNYQRQQKLAPEQVTSEKSLQAAQQELTAARSELQTAEKQFALLKSSPTPEELAEGSAKVNETEKALALAKAQRALLTIQAPLDGTVVSISARPGEGVDTTRPLVDLIDLDRLVVHAAVPADSLSLMAKGQRVRIVGDAPESSEATATQPAATQPAEHLPEATVCQIAPEIDRRTNTVGVDVQLPPGTSLRPGQYLRIRIIVEEHEKCLAVPRDSVVEDAEEHPVVAVVEPGDEPKARHAPVQVGICEGALVEVSSDSIREGDTVVTQGAYGLPPEAKVRLISH